ncbi:NAD(P)-dependent alcohol dehydrogenase [uncultured Brevundimonas sp.]|uniref:NAD(P)-dependent alcohol dehydrogenase n=1 Tax=uncultured Brevundimonas sp. TaxID=213418 RepID=UPI002618A0F2|nr:NAD(P)-dependent alcohol dehydrogenase [uncultured Brevundimonas sp.]
MDIQAAVVRQSGGPFVLEDARLNEPADDQILVKLVATGLCHTDLICRDQHYPVPLPMVFGHEGAGVVEKVGRSVTKVAPGDHVVLTFYTCGRCEACVSGDPTSCANSFVPNFMGRGVGGECTIHDHDGGELSASFFGQSSFATHALSYERNTIKVSKDVPLEILGPLGCGIQTGAGSVLNALNPSAGSTIAIFGAGAVGLSAVMAAVIAGCTTIIAVDVKENRLALATEFGATHVINAGTSDPVAEIAKICPGGVAYALETSGIPAVLGQAIASSSIGGEIGIVGAPPMGATLPVDINFLLFNRKLRGIVEGQANSEIFIPRLIALYQQGKFPFDKLIRFYEFDQINQAAADSEAGGTLKPVLRMPA